LHAFEARYERFVQTGTDALMTDYRALSATLGSEVRVIGVNEEFNGRAVELDEAGALIVETADGMRRTVLAGDVSVRGLMGYV
jgi:BirA family biotin operon repressor/biotin-[acetyl-CoA-carboxylase] ligase